MRGSSIAILSLAVLVSAAAAQAIPVNPIDPSLPLNTYTQVKCFSVPNPGGTYSTCADGRIVENPATLTSVAANGIAQSDLATGTLRAQAIGRAYWFGADQLRIGASAEAQLYDTITFGGSYVGPVEIRLTVEGSFSTTDANPNTQSSEVRNLLRVMHDSGSFIGADGLFIVQGNNGGVFLDSPGKESQTNVDPVTGLFDPANVQFYASVVFNVTPTSRTFAFLAELETTAGLGFTSPVDLVKESNVNFGNTAQLAVIAPAGVTWTSGSGLLLTPEPSSLALLGAGLGGLVWIGRGSRSRGADAQK